MPLNSPAHQMYAGLVKNGMSEKEAAKIAQERSEERRVGKEC